MPPPPNPHLQADYLIAMGEDTFDTFLKGFAMDTKSNTIRWTVRKTSAFKSIYSQSTLVTLTSLFSNNPLSPIENLVHILTW